MKGLGKLNRAFPFLPSPKISEFLSSGPEGGIFKPWQEFYFVTLTLKSHANFGTTLNAAFIISLSKIGQFLLTWWKGSKFHILLLSFVRKENWLNQKTITGVLFCDTEEPCKLWDNTECCFPYKPPPKKNWSISFDRAKRVQIWDFISLFSLKGKLLKPKNLNRSFLLWHWRAMESMEENWILLFKSVHQPPHPRKKKIDQFLCSRRKVPRFQILFLDFVWKENCLNQKTFTGVLFCDTEEPCKLWDKTECCFPNKPSKNWSISFQRAKSVQISYSTAFFCQKHKLLERKDLHRKCIWWHWRAMRTLG